MRARVDSRRQGTSGSWRILPWPPGLRHEKPSWRRARSRWEESRRATRTLGANSVAMPSASAREAMDDADAAIQASHHADLLIREQARPPGTDNPVRPECLASLTSRMSCHRASRARISSAPTLPFRGIVRGIESTRMEIPGNSAFKRSMSSRAGSSGSAPKISSKSDTAARHESGWPHRSADRGRAPVSESRPEADSPGWRRRRRERSAATIASRL